MIFGIRLKKFERLKDKPELKLNIITQLQFMVKSNYVFKTNKIQDLTFGDFVDCENFIESEQFNNFCAIFVKRKWWQTIYLHDLEPILLEYAKQKAELIEENDFIFDPPQYGEPQKETIGTELRKDFVERYGSYVILTDVVMKWANVSYKELEKWKVSEFFFWANYLTGQRIIENVK